MKLSAHEKGIVAARLQAAGIPVPVEDQSTIKPDLQVESLKGSRAFGLKMGSEFLLHLRISNHSYSTLKITQLEGHLLEANWSLIFQGDAKKYDRNRKRYRMLSGRYVRYKSALNHRVFREIAPGGNIEGKLLALSLTGKIPEEYPHGHAVPLEITLTDQYGRHFASIFEILVDRTATMSKPEVFDRTGRSLYDGAPREPVFDYRAPSQVPVGKAERGESNEKQSELMKQLTDCIASAAKADLDTMPTEPISTGDEVVVDSQYQPVERGNGRLGKGSGLYGPDATGKPSDLSFEEGARRRLATLLAQEKNAVQQRVAGIVNEK